MIDDCYVQICVVNILIIMHDNSCYNFQVEPLVFSSTIRLSVDQRNLDQSMDLHFQCLKHFSPNLILSKDKKN